MTDKELEAIRLHIAGATIQNKSPFDSLISYKNEEDLSNDFIQKWIKPFYMQIGFSDGVWINKLQSIKDGINVEVILKCLGDFNWRTRHVGAFFAAVLEQPQYVDVIGTHFLKSEVCFAGKTYSRVLAYFNTEKCSDYLNLYLDYYLTKPDLWFDQCEAMEAILYLDNVNSTNNFEKHVDNWNKFISNKPNWNREITTERLKKELDVIKRIQGKNS